MNWLMVLPDSRKYGLEVPLDEITMLCHKLSFLEYFQLGNVLPCVFPSSYFPNKTHTHVFDVDLRFFFIHLHFSIFNTVKKIFPCIIREKIPLPVFP